MANAHARIERSPFLLVILTLVVVSIGGLVEVAPLFYLEGTIEKVEGMRPYTPLELAGREIYKREGCVSCHSQMVRALRDEVDRYGHYSLAAESMYDRPFLWGSKRTGPDLARVGGRYSDEWHVEHLIDPRAVVPESIMPAYPFLSRPLDYRRIGAHLAANRTLGVPYDAEMVSNAISDLEAQVQPDSPAAAALLRRYPKAVVRNFDGNPAVISELDALIAYMQMLGTLVDVNAFSASGAGQR